MSVASIAMTLPELKEIEITKLVPHPQNPRAIMRQHVIDGIKESIERAGAFKPNHAITVRPINGHYEIISGHHRFEAAKQVGLTKVPCWIEEMDDETAFYELIRNNNQGELSPLEIGLHALEYVKLDKRGLGAVGDGIKGYANGIGYAPTNISKYRNAALVYSSFIKDNVIFNEESIKDNEYLLGKANHLGEIHKAKKECWPVLVSLLINKEWSVQETRKKVARANEFDIPEKWQEIFLPLPSVIKRSLETDEFSPKTAARLLEAVEAIEARISTYKTNTEHFINEFYGWLKENTGNDSWDVRKIEQYGRELQAKVEAAEREEQERFCFGDWREHINKLADNSAALLLTDPPYGMGYQSDYRLDRDKDRKHDEIKNDASPEDAKQEITECLSAFYTKLKEDAHIFVFCHWRNEADIRAAIESAGYKVRGSLVWVKNSTGMGDPNTTFAPKHERIIHAVKGSPILFVRQPDVFFADRCDSSRHPTEKPTDLLKQLIDVTATKDELVIDPFAGVASTLVAAKELGRAFFGCEIDEKYFAAGSDRL